jgi:heme/copper-type cytochrome/quinol oxidase subunit 2
MFNCLDAEGVINGEAPLDLGLGASGPVHDSRRSPHPPADLRTLPQQTGEQRAAPAPPTHHATSHEEAHQLALFAIAAVVVIVFLVVVIVFLPAIAQEMSQQRTADPAAP